MHKTLVLLLIVFFYCVMVAGVVAALGPVSLIPAGLVPLGFLLFMEVKE